MNEKPILCDVQSLRLQRLAGTIPTYYVSSRMEYAKNIKSMLEDAKSYYEVKLNIHLDLHLALLGLEEWQRICKIPYGMPWVSSPPHVIFLPSTSDHPLAELVRELGYGSDSIRELGLSIEEIVNSFIPLVGFHELGHICVWKYELETPTKWLNEILASYTAYAFLKARFPRSARLWQAISEMFANAYEPSHTSFSDFEALYLEVGFENYCWYQGSFQIWVNEIPETMGLSLLDKFKSLAQHAGWKNGDHGVVTDSLERNIPGFHAWAKRYRHLND